MCGKKDHFVAGNVFKLVQILIIDSIPNKIRLFPALEMQFYVFYNHFKVRIEEAQSKTYRRDRCKSKMTRERVADSKYHTFFHKRI